MSKYLLVKYLLISEKLTLLVKPFKKLILGLQLRGFSVGVPPNYAKIFANKYLLKLKKKLAPKLNRSKSSFLGVHLGVSKEWCPQTMSKYLSVKYLLISKNTGTLS